jgi:SAM-dependent methyltransferase
MLLLLICLGTPYTLREFGPRERRAALAEHATMKPSATLETSGSSDKRRSYDPSAYERLADPVKTWSAIAQRQAAKDRVLARAIVEQFVPGRVLELGGGSGDLAVLLRSLGVDIVTSDYHEFFVAHQRSLGLEAYRIDATNISAAGLGPFANIFAQSITPFITEDFHVVLAAYRSAFDALQPGGRLVLIHAMDRWRDVPQVMARHASVANRAGFSIVRSFRQQVLPSSLYAGVARWPALVLERLFGGVLGARFVLVAQKPGQNPGQKRGR